MRLTVVIVTHNRREPLRYTLSRLFEHVVLPTRRTETLVVDNGSTDGTDAMLLREYPQVHTITRPRNEGVSARNHAFAAARGEYLLLIDDDSHPVGDAVIRTIAYMDEHPRVAAVVGRVELPDGRCEASAFPSVAINCAVCLRKSAVDEVGGFPTEFFRQAEEYDLSFRLWAAGYRVERFEDIVYKHNKAAGSRYPAWIHRLDMRNNLIVAERYFPSPLRAAYRADWSHRYALLARHAGNGWASRHGYLQGRWWGLKEAYRGRQTLEPAALEAVLNLDEQAEAVADWAHRSAVRRVLIADYSKNLYATYRACRAAGLEVATIIDNHAAYRGQAYRGIPIVDDEHAPRSGVDGIVVSNVNPAQVERRRAAIASRFDLPTLTLWQPRLLGRPVQQRVA